MARPKDRRSGGAELRAWLLAEAKSVVAFLLGHDWPLGGHSSYEPTPTEIARHPFGTDVVALSEGRAYRLQRRDLPLDHPARRAGGLSDALVLTPNNELIDER
jgi:hypothetical protein